MSYKIILADGREITGLSKNGTNFVSDSRVDESLFSGNLSTMTVFDGESKTIYHNVELVQQVQYEDGWYLAFRELTAKEKKKIELDAQILALTEAMVEMQYNNDIVEINHV